MLVIRLQRLGKKHQPDFRIVVGERRAKISKKIEDLGWYSPLTKKGNIRRERLEHWVKHGALISATVRQLLTKV